MIFNKSWKVIVDYKCWSDAGQMGRSNHSDWDLDWTELVRY